MPTTISPWLAQLQPDRPPYELGDATDFDVVVVGAGIAGVSTTYALLKHTTKNILLLDAGRVAHGATGRNAGQVVSYFERPFMDIVRCFGLEMAIAGQAAVESAWDILDEVMNEHDIQTPLHKCAGYAGFNTIEQVITHLEEVDIRNKAGLKNEPLLLRTDDTLMQKIPEHLRTYVMQVPHSVILRALETDDQSFIATEVSRKGCMNSALFCEELVGKLHQTYPDRLTVAENLPVETVILRHNDAELLTKSGTITTRKVVLCTNGFENFTIENQAGADIDPSFHATVHGVIGYMAGYMDEPNQVPAAISYYRSKIDSGPYHYLTRRPYDESGSASMSLICIGGPERPLPDRATYDPSTAFPADIEEELDRELRLSFQDLPPYAARTYLWQGLMGYTPNQIRRIGYEPLNDVLLYNLGCNGVGILPSVYGGKRIAQLLAGIHLPPSIFDPAMGNL